MQEALKRERPDILIADFEGKDYGDWTAAGDGFGTGPLRQEGENPPVYDRRTGTPLHVTGFEGRGLAACVYKNGELAGGAARGTLISPEFIIERTYINLKIGGGWYPERTCVNLFIDGKRLFSQHGIGTGFGHQHNDMVLRWFSWDVKRHIGKKARIEIVDKFDHDLGVIFVDHIVQSDIPKEKPICTTPFDETFRPQFHFTADKGWMNDPCGLFHYNGTYHLMFQHADSGELSALFGPMAWGHAVSGDLLHWRQLSDVIKADDTFDWSGYPCFAVACIAGEKPGTIMSGSTVIDVDNDTGLQIGSHPPILSFYTDPDDSACGQCMAYSLDGGWSWRKYQGNPVIPGPGIADRDPKVFKHNGRWYLVLSHAWGPHVERDRFTIHLYESDIPTQWEHIGEIPDSENFCECPDLFPMPLDGDAKNIKWLLVAGDGKHVIGRFDGNTFYRETEPLRGDHGRNHLATQTWFDGKRRIQIAWMTKNFALPHMPFNQQMTFPRVLELKSTRNGVRIYKTPVQEIESIRKNSHFYEDLLLSDSAPDRGNPLESIDGELFDINLELEPGTSSRTELSVRGTPVEYDSSKGRVRCLDCTLPLAPIDGRVKIRILVDRISIEIFGNDGEATMTNYFLPPIENKSLALAVTHGACRITKAEIHELHSIWNR